MEKPRSQFEKVVYLRSWWLDNSEKGLLVAGFSNREKEARRVFISAPILKRHDDFNLETVDRISVRLHGFIDKPRTQANGFSSQIFRHFLFGFPAWWEECAKNCVNTTQLFAKNNTGIEAASPQERGIIEHGTADEDIVPGCLDSSNAHKYQYLRGETVLRNHTSVSNFEKQGAKQGEATLKPASKKIIKKDLASAGKSKSAIVNENLFSRDAENKSAHVDESTPVHDKLPILSPEAASFRRSRSEHETAHEDILPGCLDSSNADKDQYLGRENVQSNHSYDSNIERQDARQADSTAKPNRRKRTKKFTQASRNSRSLKNDVTDAGKRKRSATPNLNLSQRKAEKKLAHSTPVHDKVPILSPEATSFRRSRSGRLLLPALEYWHNQRAVYDVDRKIIGVEGVLDH